MLTRRTKTLPALIAAALVLAACGGAPSAPAEAPKSTDAPKQEAPAAATNLVEASKQESEGLLIYSIMSQANWKPVLDGFGAKYPWIKVTTTDLGAYEVFERYYTESAGNARTADLIVTAAPDGWIKFAQKGEVEPYVSTENDVIPAFAKVAPGIYAVSTDPMVTVYNKKLLANPPKSFSELVTWAEKDKANFEGKFVSYDADGEGFGYGLNYYYTKAKGDAGWKNLETLGNTKVKILTSGGKMIDSVLAGESSVGYFVSLITVKPREAKAKDVLGWTYVPDAQIVVVRPMGVTKKAKSPASAKLLLDYILSQEGQIAFAKGGLTAYRPDVADKAPLHLSQVAKEVGGEANLIFSYPSEEVANATTRADFLTRWKKALQREK
jgi:iron(III) transport system substrate-binding protein